MIRRFIAAALFRIWSGADHTHHATSTNDRKDSKAGYIKKSKTGDLKQAAARR